MSCFCDRLKWNSGQNVHAWKLLLAIGPTFNLPAHNLGLSLTKSKMVEHTEEELIYSIKEALRHKKSAFQRRIANGHKLRDLDITFNRLNQISELAVKENFEGIRERPKHKLGELYPKLEHCIIRVNSPIDRRLSPRMSKFHPLMVVFDLPMARGVFNLLQKEILGRTRYGVEVEEKPGSVKITFFCLRRLCHLFDQFEDCGEFIKQLGEGKGQSKLIVSEDKKGVMTYNEKAECLQAKFHYGYRNSFGIRQH